jgi:hypothetical protein
VRRCFLQLSNNRSVIWLGDERSRAYTPR